MECIKFKKVEKKDITMEDVLHFLENDPNVDAICTYMNDGELWSYETVLTHILPRRSKVAAYAALSDIAEYYNRGWKPNWKNDYEKKWFIYYNHIEDAFRLDNQYSECHGCVYFKNMNDTQAVIHNPNFREILDVLLKS